MSLYRNLGRIPTTLNPKVGKVAPHLSSRSSKGLYLFDIDETLAMRTDAKDSMVNQILASGGPRRDYDWGPWNALLPDDTPNPPVAEIFRRVREEGFATAAITARDETARAATDAWMHKHDLVPDALLMRNLEEELDIASSGELKHKMIDHHIPKRMQGSIKAIYDDSSSVTKMARGRGIPSSDVVDHAPGPLWINNPPTSTARQQLQQQNAVGGSYLGMPLDRIYHGGG